MDDLGCMIFSTRTGQGHNSASLALRDELRRQGCRCEVFDILNSGKKPASDRVSSLYSGMTNRAPAFFGALYHAGERVSSPTRRSPIYYLNSLYSDRLMTRIERFAPKAIVCPHIFSAQAVTYLSEKRGLRIPSVGIVTDYTCSPFWEETRLSAYVIPCARLSGEFAAKGLPVGKLHPLGIPVSARFRTRHDRRSARAAFGLGDGPVYVIMGGSMGYGNLPLLACELLRLSPDAQVAVACGRNPSLYRKLQNHPRLLALPYIENADILMDCADVLLTKPGGLSSTEAMVKNVPIVFTKPIPGGEPHNAAFFQSLGVALWESDSRRAAQAAHDLLLDRAAQERMLAAQRQFINANADADIARLVLRLAGRENEGLPGARENAE